MERSSRSLEPGHAYHFRVVAENDSGTSYGPDKRLQDAAVLEPVVIEPDPVRYPEPDPVKEPEPEPDFGKTIVAAPTAVCA